MGEATAGSRARSCTLAPAERGSLETIASDALTDLSNAALLSLLRMCSSLFPIGAFAYSQGLEGAVEAGWVDGEEGLCQWLDGVGETTLAYVDLPLLRLCQAAWVDGDHARALTVSRRVLANRETKELLQQERQLGSAFAAVLTELGVSAAATFRDSDAVSYVGAFGLGAAHHAIPLSSALHGYTYCWLEQQVNAAIRLLPIGHLAGQRCLSRLLKQAPTWIQQSLGQESDTIGSATFGLALASSWHEKQYSRLFRT